MAGDWLGPALAFVGAGAGSVLSYVVARRDLRQRSLEARDDVDQREDQSRREEWGRRFTAALDDIASGEFRRRELGRAVLVHLSQSELATEQERRLADVVLETGARLEADGDVLRDLPQGITVDELSVEEDDG